MFLKAKVVRKNGKTHTYWQLVRSIRTAKGPRHRAVAYLGELHPSEKSGWARLMGNAEPPVREPGCPLWDSEVAVDPVPEAVEVQVRGIRVERSREFGDVYLGLALWSKNSRAAGLFDIRVEPIDRDGRPGLQVTWTKKDQWRQWAVLSHGCYLLRTNLRDRSPQDLWRTYIQLTQAESAFRTHKSELALRPIWHQARVRVQAHILFSFLAYAMWKTLEEWMARSQLGHGVRTVIGELARIKLSDVVLPTTTGRRIRLRCVTDADEPQRVLLSRLGLELPTRLGEPRWLRETNVVPN